MPYAAGDAIATVETEKAIVDVEAEAGGVILRRVVAEGTKVEVGSPIAVWGTTGESDADVATSWPPSVCPPLTNLRRAPPSRQERDHRIPRTSRAVRSPARCAGSPAPWPDGWPAT